MADGYLSDMRASDDVGDGRGRAPKPPEEAAGVFGARAVEKEADE